MHLITELVTWLGFEYALQTVIRRTCSPFSKLVKSVANIA